MEKYSITNIYTRALVSLLIFFAFTGFNAAVAIPLRSTSDPAVYVDPPLYRATHLGEVFQIAIKIANVTTAMHLLGAEFKLGYNGTLLQTQEAWFIEGGFFKAFGATYSTVLIETDAGDQKYVHAFVLLLPSENGTYSSFPQGGGTLATISFNATYRPTEPLEASCELRMFDTILVDHDVNMIPHAVAGGVYQMASLRFPTLEVLPKQYTALRKGETFEVKVNIKDVDTDWRLVGLQFRLRYNTSLLETEPDWITEGTFFKAHGTTWFDAFVENDYGLVGVIILPGLDSIWHGPFPEGEGTVATLTFKTIYQPVEPEASSSCGLTLDDTILVNDKTEPLTPKTSNGQYMIVAATPYIDQYRPVDVQLDVGATHFRGELADFYALVTDFGKVVDPDNLTAALYFEGARRLDVTAAIEQVSKGLFRIAYTIPLDAQPGTYVLLVQAEYANVSGSAIKSFLVSSTLSNWNSYILSIKDNIATVIIPAVGQTRLDLMAINATLLSINGRTATISTAVGDLTTDIANLNATLVRVDGNVATIQTNLGTLRGRVDTVEGETATIKTDVGDIKVKVSDLPGNVQTSINLLYATVVLALIAAIGAMLAFLNTRKRKP
jgi:hypothetical protein